ncbi:hypothetical protein CCACVL1_29486 [Corchorus capsularis]|uniref:Uncharacterized protein n=1 Tax=Corchorus capsularis TaxID=210143 RepID=A0A1R3G1J1_COCAP|nr:hypothetical protein CCACVL1_29486 [Corchorus capsularis]
MAAIESSSNEFQHELSHVREHFALFKFGSCSFKFYEARSSSARL